MKSSKASSIAVLIIALMFAIFGTVFLFVKEPVSPVTVSGTPKASKSGGEIIVTFTLTNESEEDVKITYILFEVATNHRTERADITEAFTIAAGGSQVLRCGFDSNYYPEKVNEIQVRANGEKYNVYGGTSTFKMAAVVLYIIAVVVGILAVISFIGAKKQQKRYDAINQELATRFGGTAVFVLGAYSKKGEGGKAAAKTAMSVAGGTLFAALFGFGAFKVYGANAPKEFVVSDEGLFVGNAMKKGFNLGNMTYFAKGTLNNSEVEVKKNNVIMSNVSTGEFFMFNLTRNSSITADALAEKLKALAIPVNDIPDETASDTVEVSKENDNSDPFDI